MHVEPCTIPLSSLKILTLYTIHCGFVDLQILKIRCVNYAPFPKSGQEINMLSYVGS